ncbi:MAG: dihydrofolate reductase [Clostridia bacterium]
MKTIVAVDSTWGIGKNNDLLFSIPEDMQFFKQTTLDKIIVMGSNTLLSFPSSKPLKHRTNIVLWPGEKKRDDCIIVNSINELSETLRGYSTDDTFIVGGAMFYKTMLPYCDTAYITKVQSNGQATVFFENLDKLPNWSLISESSPINNGNYTFTFCTYKNNSPLKF